MDQQRRVRLLRLATRASVATAVVLIVVKLWAWWITESVSVMASLIDSMMDALASLLNLVAVRYSLQPADDDHRFGHGKAEPLA
ncbi:MAG: cation transporter, partial [Gammaproteobacteria bacterium]|nr:cation transporter [Gammaproteobacteria bacterium]